MMTNWNALIPDAPFDWALIPLDGRKRPIDPDTGDLKDDWQQQDGYDVDGISALNGQVHAVGLMLGEKSGGVLQVDYDGPASPAKFQEVYGKSPKDLPRTIGVTSGKESRGSRFILVDRDWWDSLRGRKAWKDADGDICLELRWAGHQAVIAGKHPETNGYSWMANSSPADLEMAMAPDWLLEPLIRTEATYEPVQVSAEDAQRAIAMLQCIDPNSRTNYDGWLEIGMALHHTDEGLLFDWIEWSKQMPNFDEAECLQKWQGFADYKGQPLTIGTLHHYAKKGGYIEPKHQPVTKPQGGVEGDPALPPIDQWDEVLKGLVDPDHECFEKNSIRRQIRAATSARELGVSASPNHVRATLLQHQRNLITGTAEKGTKGGEKAKFKQREYLINNLIAMRCLTGIAAFNKVGKTKVATDLVASLIYQIPFLGNPEWTPAPPPPEGHKFILWWVDQPGADSSNYLKARGLMDADGTLHPQIVSLYTEEDDLAWDDQGMDRLIQDTANNPGAILITDSFFACIQRVHGNDQEPEAGGALIDVQTLLSQTETTHVCLFHSPKETGPVGINAIRGHGSAGGAVSGCISMHFLEKKDPQTGKWVADKENPHRRMVFEGRGPYIDLLIRGDWENGTFNVLGNFQQKLGELTADDRKASTIDELTQGQRETLEFLAGACGIWKDPNGATAQQVAACRVQHLNREPTPSEVESTRRQLNALVKEQLASQTKKGQTFKYTIRS